MNKILLLTPPVFIEETYGKFADCGSSMPFLGICYLASILKQAGFDVKILDAIILRLGYDEILECIGKFDPEIIGVTVSTFSSLRAAKIAKRIKKRFPYIKLVAGGPHILECTKSFFAESDFDVAVLGEGENTFLELCDAIINKRPYSTVNGLMYKDRSSGSVVTTVTRCYQKNLDEIPFPARELLPPLKLYTPSALYHKRTPIAHIFTSRGCPGECIFCETPFGKTVRYHSPAYVVDEMLMLKKDYAIREILINDDTFVIDKKRTHEICSLMRKKSLDIIWSCNIRVNLVDYDVLKDMRESGCWLIMPGVESGSQKILNILKKGITIEQVNKTCEWAHSLGIIVKPSFIIGNPGDTIDTINETIRFAKSLKTHYPSFTLFTPYPGSKSYEIAKKCGNVYEDVSRFALSSLEPSFVPTGLTSALIKQKQEEGFKKLYFDLGMICRHLTSINNFEDVRKMVGGLLMLLKMKFKCKGKDGSAHASSALV